RRAAGAATLTFLTAAIDDPRFSKAPADVVLAFSLLHLLPDPDAALAVIRAQVKPGGLFISKTICVAEMPVWVPPILAVMRAMGRAPHLRRYSGAQIEAAIARAGFDIVTSRIFGDVRYARFIVARRKA
ncbi:MAG: methyltransferase domain-containing protein, partial [Proteobacteria bacterium]|nr:methyltransferase domain-containing protein [Pseudomonadota bacterium]